MPLHQTGDGSDFIADSVNYITETCFLCENNVQFIHLFATYK